ncbi:16003_t:CDS:2, partial [Cetraspora pellucida]
MRGWCGPCKLLAPILQRIVADNKKVTLVKINTDDNQDLAERYRITGLPTVYSFHKGKPVDHFIGVKSEGAVKEFVEKAAASIDKHGLKHKRSDSNGVRKKVPLLARQAPAHTHTAEASK